MITIKYSRLHVSAHAYFKKSNSIYNMNSMLILSESSRPLHRNQRSIGHRLPIRCTKYSKLLWLHMNYFSPGFLKNEFYLHKEEIVNFIYF